jgi:hypothetical protein
VTPSATASASRSKRAASAAARRSAARAARSVRQSRREGTAPPGATSTAPAVPSTMLWIRRGRLRAGHGGHVRGRRLRCPSESARAVGLVDRERVRRRVRLARAGQPHRFGRGRRRAPTPRVGGEQLPLGPRDASASSPSAERMPAVSISSYRPAVERDPHADRVARRAGDVRHDGPLITRRARSPANSCRRSARPAITTFHGSTRCRPTVRPASARRRRGGTAEVGSASSSGRMRRTSAANAPLSWSRMMLAVRSVGASCSRRAGGVSPPSASRSTAGAPSAARTRGAHAPRSQELLDHPPHDAAAAVAVDLDRVRRDARQHHLIRTPACRTRSGPRPARRAAASRRA